MYSKEEQKLILDFFQRAFYESLRKRELTRALKISHNLLSKILYHSHNGEDPLSVEHRKIMDLAWQFDKVERAMITEKGAQEAYEKKPLLWHIIYSTAEAQDKNPQFGKPSEVGKLLYIIESMKSDLFPLVKYE